MNMAHRDQSAAQRWQRPHSGGGADVAATRVAPPKTAGTPRAEWQFGAISTVTQRTGAAAQNGGYGRAVSPWG